MRCAPCAGPARPRRIRVGAYDPLSLAGIIVPAEEPDGAIPTVSEAG